MVTFLKGVYLFISYIKLRGKIIKKKKFKITIQITIPFIDEGDGRRFIEALDLHAGISYDFYEVEFEQMEGEKYMEVKEYVMRRMHFIKAGAYDDENTTDY